MLDEFINNLAVKWNDPGVLQVRLEVLADIKNTAAGISILDPVRDAMMAFRIPTEPLIKAVFATKDTGIRGALYRRERECPHDGRCHTPS